MKFEIIYKDIQTYIIVIMEGLRISVITATAKLSKPINLENLYKCLEVNDTIHYVEHKCENKGYSVKLTRKTRKKREKKSFYNQVTIHVFDDKIVNLKIFNNGKLQMTGLKSVESGKRTIESFIREISDKNREVYEGDLEYSDYKIAMINSDFDIKYKVDREQLHRCVVDMGMCSSYEPTIYPGVNMKYYYNTNNTNGICCCNAMCDGKGNADGDGNCKRVTIAVFNSGKIIITGGNHLKQLKTCHKFISGVLKDRKKYEMVDYETK